VYRALSTSDELGGFLQDNHMCPELAHILVDSLHCEKCGRHPAFRRRHGFYDPEFSALIQAQANLCWSQLFQGRLAHHWSRLQDKFLKTNKDELELDRRYFTGDIWAWRKLVSLIWFAMRMQWDFRNADRHGHTKEANHVIRQERLLQLPSV
jgi:hypothetical protein